MRWSTLVSLGSLASVAAGCLGYPEELPEPWGSSDNSSAMNVTTIVATDTSSLDSSSSGSSSGSSSTTGPIPCVSNEECIDPATPFCGPVSGECVGCDGVADPDSACASVSGRTPVCVDGTCVQCTAVYTLACTGSTPICDDATSTCVPCTAHEQCGEAACNLFTGACLPGDAVVHVGGAAPDFLGIDAAVASFGPGEEGTIVVHARGTYNNQPVTVSDGQVLAFLAAEIGAGVVQPLWFQSGGGALPQLRVEDATVILDGLQVSGNASSMVPGLQVVGGRLWVDRSSIVNNLGGGISAQEGAEISLRNSFVGGDQNDRAALEIDGAMAAVLYSTLGTGFGTAPALTCSGAATVHVRNSLMVSRDTGDEVICPVAAIENSAAEMSLGGTNTVLPTMDVAWFESYAAGDFHLAARHPAVIDTTARWSVGDPPADFDGDPRPIIDGDPDYAGADVP